ncbi:MAG: acetyl-CoA carboxylase biotin carboxyl carrier protein subunit [Gammaproteobacteria bacterium]|nr:acetyl-CoA carboxylase biotin carboxyl carrier protein subunit [Gammaproteobacteria bacterium]
MAHEIELQTAGNMWKVLVKPGDKVEAGDTLFIMEVMKMEVPHEAPAAGTVTAVNVSDGEEGLEAGMIAVVIE